MVKPISENEPTPPETSEPYCLSMASNSCAGALVFPSSGSSSELTKILLFHFGPSDCARKSVLHGVEQAQYLTRSSRLSFCAAFRITSASGGVKLSTTAPFGPAALTSSVATESALVIGTFVVKSWIGTPLALARVFGPAAM